MAIDPPDPDPELDRRRELIVHCEKRCDRARAKLIAAQQEVEDADSALAYALSRRDQWIADHPDPQPSLPL